MAHRYITFGNGQQTGQARLGGQQVIKTSITLLLGDPVANVKQMAAVAVEEAEIGLPGQLLQCMRQREKTFRHGACTGCLLNVCLHIQVGRAQGVAIVGQQPFEFCALGRSQGAALCQQGCSRRFKSLSACKPAWVSKGACASSRQAWATANKWPLRLPLSTVETYMGSRGWPFWVSYQFMK